MSLSRLSFLAVISLALTASAYEDDYLEIAGDESVRTNWVGERIVYIFTNTASAATANFKQNMTLQEVLLVGGGGAGGGFKGGGGGGGGVISDATKAFCAEGATFSVTVGKGGVGNASRVAAKPGGGGAGYGDSSSFAFQGSTRTAFGGGGGGSDKSSSAGVPSKMTSTLFIGCGGGAGSGMTGNQTDEYYTSDQGCYGGIANGGTGGGGGALTSGENGRSGQSGNGGEGVTNSITGVAEVYGSGGGGGGAVSINSGACNPGVGGTHAGDGVKGKEPAKAGSGENGFGAGGGGGGYDGGASAGGDGGSGIVVLAFTVGGEASRPEIREEDITVAYPNGETQPYVSVFCGGAEDATYSANVLVLCGTNGTDYVSTNSDVAVVRGQTVEGWQRVYPRPGDTFFVKVIASAEGVDDVVVTRTLTVPTDQGLVVPPHVGRGGGAGVIHVRPGAHGNNDGTSWTDAYVDFRAAIKELSEDRRELWLAGDETVGVSAATISPVTNAVIRGGFAGVENSPSERAKGCRSVLDGQGLYNPFSVNNAHAVTIDGFRTARVATRAVTKSGAGDIMVTNCVFGPVSRQEDAMALQLTGTAGKTLATLVDCQIVSNTMSNAQGSQDKVGVVSIANMAHATLTDCRFVGNGTVIGAEAYTQLSRLNGAALRVSNAPVTVERCRFLGNGCGGSSKDDTGGIVLLTGACDGSEFRNCIWAGNFGVVGIASTAEADRKDRSNGALTVKMSAGCEVLVENCTFAYNLHEGASGCAGLNVRTGCALVRNTIFAHNASGKLYFATPADIYVQAGATATVYHTSFTAGAADRLDEPDGSLTVDPESCFEADPLLVTSPSDLGAYIRTNGSQRISFVAAKAESLLGVDCHLQSVAGYRTNADDAWHTDVFGASPAIDKGDKASPCENEPEPNGGRINLGAYGNTLEASKTASAKSEFDGPVVLSFVGDTTQPTVAFKLGGVAYVADATIYLSSNGTDWAAVKTLRGCAAGQAYAAALSLCVEPQTHLYVKVELFSEGYPPEPSGADADVTGKYPPSWQKGGGAGVIHVRADATGDGSGSDWFNAMTSVDAALERITEERSEVWIATNALSCLVATSLKPAFPLSLRGGFVGTECALSARAAGSLTTVDGANAIDCATLANEQAVTLEGLRFIRGKAHGIAKSGAGDLVVTNCVFESNGGTGSISSESDPGRAMNLSGGGHVTIAGCRIACHREGGSVAGSAGAIHLSGLADATIADTLFVSNGLSYAAASLTDLSGRQGTWGVALAVDNTRVTVERCAFRVNCVPSVYVNGHRGGGIVVLRGACGGSVFRNCAWVGNESLQAKSSSYSDPDSGSLVVTLDDQAESVAVVNCTFAGNLYEGVGSTAGVNVKVGTVGVMNTIFCGNVCGNTAKWRPTDVLVQAGATLTAGYTLFSGETNRLAEADGTLVCGKGCTDDDALLVTPSNAVLSCIAKSKNTGYYLKDASIPELLAYDVHEQKHSLAVDTGDPKSPYGNEPLPNGRRVNLGAYGNTPEAMRSASGTVLILR